MSKKSNLINFDKEIASSIGLNEAIVLQVLKAEKKQDLASLIDKLSFIEEERMLKVLKKLLKLKLIEEPSKETYFLKSKNKETIPERKQNISKGYLPSDNILKEAKSLGISKTSLEINFLNLELIGLIERIKAFLGTTSF